MPRGAGAFFLFVEKTNRRFGDALTPIFALPGYVGWSTPEQGLWVEMSVAGSKETAPKRKKETGTLQGRPGGMKRSLCRGDFCRRMFVGFDELPRISVRWRCHVHSDACLSKHRKGLTEFSAASLYGAIRLFATCRQTGETPGGEAQK